MKRPILSALSLLFIILGGIIFFFHHQHVQESIIFFPIAENVHFKEAATDLTLEYNLENKEYSVEWNVNSELDRNAYLRQDISFLFANNRLIAKTSDWKENKAKLTQFNKVYDSDTAHFQAISFHYAELHKDDDIKSSQQMSADELYVIDSSFSQLQSFRNPKTPDQKEWKQVLDSTSKQQLQYSLKKLMVHFDVPSDTYHFFPLTELAQTDGISSNLKLNNQKSQIIIGQLWEGLYKNYFLGIKKKNGSIIEPLGSTIPFIGISKDFKKLIVLIEAKDGTPIQLIQSLSAVD